MLEHSVNRITKHTGVLKDPIEEGRGDSKPEKCKGMKGLVSEASKHGMSEAPNLAGRYPEQRLSAKSKP